MTESWADTYFKNMQKERELVVAKMLRDAPPAEERGLKWQTCPQCNKPFRLTWQDYSSCPETLSLRGCPSGGIYDVRINCPHCNYEEAL